MAWRHGANDRGNTSLDGREAKSTICRQEKLKSEKKSAEETLEKITIGPLKDAVDYSVWAVSVQNIKVQTAAVEPEKKNPDWSTWSFYQLQIEDKDLKDKLVVIQNPYLMLRQIQDKYRTLLLYRQQQRLG